MGIETEEILHGHRTRDDMIEDYSIPYDELGLREFFGPTGTYIGPGGLGSLDDLLSADVDVALVSVHPTQEYVDELIGPRVIDEFLDRYDVDTYGVVDSGNFERLEGSDIAGYSHYEDVWTGDDECEGGSIVPAEKRRKLLDYDFVGFMGGTQECISCLEDEIHEELEDTGQSVGTGWLLDVIFTAAYTGVDGHCHAYVEPDRKAVRTDFELEMPTLGYLMREYPSKFDRVGDRFMGDGKTLSPAV